MILARSILYVIFLYILMALVGLLFLPAVLIAGRKAAARAAHVWATIALGGLRAICATRHEVRGAEHLSGGPLLIASKHQAMWETLFFLKLLKAPAIVLKKELLGLPVYGWYARKLEMIAVDRDQGSSAIRSMTHQAVRALSEGRPIVIFPEGTRQAPGAAPSYKPGIALLYQRLGVPCVPAALNSGLYWDGKGLWRRPGKIVIEFLKPIPPGLDREDFMMELERGIETATKRLIAETREAGSHPQNRLKVVDA